MAFFAGCRLGAAMGAFGLVLLASGEAQAMQGIDPSCDGLREALSASQNALPRQELRNAVVAGKCLIGILQETSLFLTSELTPKAAVDTTIVAGALRQIIAEGDVEVTRQLRNEIELGAVSVLSFGVRNAEYSTRLNSTIALASLVDNSNVCVVIDHFYDERNKDSEHWINGRANLLTVMSAIAPWVYRENYLAMEQALEVMNHELATGSIGSSNNEIVTVHIPQTLERLQARLLQPVTYRNFREVSLPEALGDCQDYVPRWAPHEYWPINQLATDELIEEGDDIEGRVTR